MVNRWLGKAVMAWVVAMACAQPAVLAQQQTQADERFKRALELFQTRDFERSGELLEQLTNANPRNALYWFNLGNARYMKHELKEALAAYGRVSALKSPLAAAADLYSAKAKRQLGDLAGARRILENLAGRTLTANLAAEVRLELAALQAGAGPLEEAVAAFQSRAYDRAIELASRALEREASADAYLLRGMAEMRLARDTQAAADFDEAIARSKDSGLSKTAGELRDQAQQRLVSPFAARRYWLLGDLAAGYNNNVFSDAVSVPHTAKPVVDGFLSLGAVPYRSGGLAARLGYALTWEETLGIVSLRFQVHYGYGQLEYGENGWSVLAQPGGQYITLGSNTFMKKLGGKLRIQKSVGSNDFGASWEATSNTPGATRFSYLEGSSQLRKVYWGYTATNMYFNLAYLDSVQYSSDLLLTNGILPTGYAARGPGLLVSVYPVAAWELSFNGRYLFKSFRDQAYTNDVATDRSDRLLDATATVTCRLTGSLRLYTSFELIRNWSNLDINSVADKSYDQVIALGGLSWDVLP